MVSKDVWQKAQEEERKWHTMTFDAGYEHYKESYRQYFEWVGIDPDLQGKSVVEIGPADFPALGYCTNGWNCLIIEPMPSEHLKRFDIPICTDLAEDAIYECDEVWFFNVLQHVIDPNKIIERAKKQSKVIRFFEPIDYGIDVCHPWNLTEEMFKDWFGNVKIYPPNPNANCFHTWKCCYGVWTK
jgi:hypothetical protein